jgi:ferredoxin
MSSLIAEVHACQGCGACLLTCPEHAIRPHATGTFATLDVHPGRCTGCGECAEVCPVDAIALVERTPLQERQPLQPESQQPQLQPHHAKQEAAR